MTNPTGVSAGVKLTITKNGTSDTIIYDTYADGDNSRLLPNWEVSIDENYPKSVTFNLENGRTRSSTSNLLNSSCDLWTGATTGAIKEGDEVLFEIYDDDGSDTETMLWARIIEVRSIRPNEIFIRADDKLKKLDYMRGSKVFFDNYLDKAYYDTDISDGIRRITGITSSGVVEPFAFVGFAHTDTRVNLGGGSEASGFEMWEDGDKVAQAFVAQGDAFIGVEFEVYRHSTTSPSQMTISLQADMDNVPSGVYLADKTITSIPVGTTSYDEFLDPDLGNAGDPTWVVKGNRYWIVFEIDNEGTASSEYVEITTEDDNGDPINCWWQNDGGGGWTKNSDEQLDIIIDVTEYEEVTNYIWDDSNDRILLLGNYQQITKDSGATYYSSLNRGCCSFYYGSVTIDDIINDIMKLNTGILGAASSDLNRDLNTYAMKGKRFSECLRELCDLFQVSGTYDGYQGVFAYYENSGVPTLKAGRRLYTSNSAKYILSYPADTSNDDEHIIVGNPQLKLSGSMKYAGVQMQGKDHQGNPLVVTRNDRSASDSYYNQVDGMAETLVIHDESTGNYEDLVQQSFLHMSRINRNIWEGSISLAGVHHLFDVDTTSPSYGSGHIITLNWSPLGISTEKFKVTGMRIRKNQTDIYITNRDPVLQNKISESELLSQKNESYLAPIGQPGSIYVQAYLDAVPAGAYYLALFDVGGTEIENYTRQLCTVTESADYFSTDPYNNRCHYAEFKDQHGYTYFQSSLAIGMIKLMDAPRSGSVQHTIDLVYSASSVEYDTRFFWAKGTRLIVEINCNES